MIYDVYNSKLSSESLFYLNHNVFVCGSSGSGKTVFANGLLDYFDDSIRFISSKDEEGFLLSHNLPFLASGVNDWIDSFLVTLPDPNGFMSSQIGPILSGIISHIPSENKLSLKGFKDTCLHLKRTAEKMNKPIYDFILNRVKSLYPDVVRTWIFDPQDFPHSIDIYSLSLIQKPFFLEFMLRIFWHSKIKPLNLWIDEFHHLSNFQFSIVGEILREIRSRGSVVAISQNMVDVLPSYLSQFGSVFIGNSFNSLDLALFPYHNLASKLLSLGKYSFVELRSALSNTSVLEIYHAGGLKTPSINRDF